MKHALLIAAGLLLAGSGARAQATNCGLNLTKSGTGLNRAYTLAYPASVPASGLYFDIVPSTGTTVSGTGINRTTSYTYGGVYVLILASPNYCTDSIHRLDTVAGPMNCNDAYATLTATASGSNRTFTNRVRGSWGLDVYNPSYTSTTTYNYGDGTTGTSATHTYPPMTHTTSYTVTASTVFTSTVPGYPSCTKTATTTVSVVPVSCNATLSKSGTGQTRTYTIQSNATNPTYSIHAYSAGGSSYSTFVTTNPFTLTYPQGGVYALNVVVRGTNCVDSFDVLDTVAGPINCASLTHSMINTGGGATGMFYHSGTVTAAYPGYTRSVSYNYGDGTSGTSNMHTYTASGTYLVTATTTLSSATYGTCTVVDTVTVTAQTPLNRIYANATWDSSLNAAGASMKFWLIQYDSTSQTLTVVDSALVPVAGGFNASATFINKPAGSYRVKAHLLNQPASWTTHLLPTYSYSAAYWQYASVIHHTGGTVYGNVFMQQGTATSGPGFIGGLVTQGANRGGATGDPMANTTIFLRDQSGVPVATALTDAQGQYRFTNLAYGTYSVYPEALNYTTTPSQPITLDATQPAAHGYHFRQELIARTFDPYFVPVAVSHTSVAPGISLYPNPVQQTLYVRLGTGAVSGTLEVYTLTGQRVKGQAIELGRPVQELATEGLANGTYLLQLPTAEGRQVRTITIQK